MLDGGQHAITLLAEDEAGKVVVRVFPAGDDAVSFEMTVLDQIGALGDLVPRYVAHGSVAGQPMIVTSAVRGSAASPTLPLDRIAEEMAVALARIHQLDGSGLRDTFQWAPSGVGKLADAARAAWESLDLTGPVLTHYDFWSGNALWDGDSLTGVADWSGARRAPRGVDVAWCRQDLVLLGSRSAAEHFLGVYEARAGVDVADISAWDLLAAAHADPGVESWAANYEGVGRPDITPTVLRHRLDSWTRSLDTP